MTCHAGPGPAPPCRALPGQCPCRAEASLRHGPPASRWGGGKLICDSSAPAHRRLRMALARSCAWVPAPVRAGTRASLVCPAGAMPRRALPGPVLPCPAKAGQAQPQPRPSRAPMRVGDAVAIGMWEALIRFIRCGGPSTRRLDAGGECAVGCVGHRVRRIAGPRAARFAGLWGSAVRGRGHTAAGVAGWCSCQWRHGGHRGGPSVLVAVVWARYRT